MYQTGQILLLTKRLGTKRKRTYEKELVAVILNRDGFEYPTIRPSTVAVKVIATPHKDTRPIFSAGKTCFFLSSINMMIDRTYMLSINDFKANGHKVELVGKTYLPRCLSWDRGETYEKLLKGEPL